MNSKPAILALGLSLGLGTSVFATSTTTVSFGFDTQTINGATVTSGISALGSGASSAAIATYMNQVLAAAGCTGCTVTVKTGNTSPTGNTMGAVTDTTYSGDGHVVGKNNSSGSFEPVTLGTTNGATSNSSNTPSATYDTFIANTNDSSTQISTQITLQFSGFTGRNLTINGFDYEIFPDGTGQIPDMTFEAGTGTGGVDTPVTSFGTNGTQDGVTPGTTNGSDTKSNTSTNEASLQYIGTWSSAMGVSGTEFDFVDWPATIGLDNIKISFNTTPSVPEPTSIALLGTVAVGLLFKKLRKA